MNPMTNVKNIKKLSEQDIRLGGKSSWHDQYKDSAWIFIGGLPYDLTEGDIICVFSQYGEVVHINLVRDKETGKQKGFCFLCYEDQKSTILAVDNFNGIKILGRTLRVDHVENYKAPKEGKHPVDDETKLLREEGCAPLSKIAQSTSTTVPVPKPPEDLVVGGVRLPPRLPIEIKTEKETPVRSLPKKKKEHKSKKEKISKREHKRKEQKNKKKRSRKESSSESSSSSSSSSSDSDSSDSSRDNRRKKSKSGKR